MVASNNTSTLVYRDLEGWELVGPAVNRLLVVDTVEAGVAAPERTLGPLAKHLGLAGVGTRRNSGIETGRLVAVLDPVDHNLHVVLRVRSGLERVGSAVGGTGD